jgi:hypothetical protein
VIATVNACSYCPNPIDDLRQLREFDGVVIAKYIAAKEHNTCQEAELNSPRLSAPLKFELV